ncbi:ECU09_1525 [Encephalitozoon cuniculi GB-M1]|uniref:ECU09_1525 protein n=1 Tax=Encephalitozoon cuniculi (strain GB-M1) TaxID=284813 RepID=I7IV48_ENCCU|nr:uncharacterized protein ECU09_1525 [Encephalitozoon cuniculi GB-M1]CCI73981.1 ECU09_1525 [Encephalitozoon cuniculi GB-M1]
MEQIECIRATLNRVNFSDDSLVRAGKLSIIQGCALDRLNNTIPWAFPFYIRALDRTRNDLESKRDSQGIAAVDEAKKALEVLLDHIKHQIPCLTEKGDERWDFEYISRTLPNYFQKVDDLKGNY